MRLAIRSSESIESKRFKNSQISENVIQKSTLQSVSFCTLTQKKLRPLIERRKNRLPFDCSITHSGLFSIRLANLFLALLDFGVTNAVSNMLETHRT